MEFSGFQRRAVNFRVAFSKVYRQTMFVVGSLSTLLDQSAMDLTKAGSNFNIKFKTIQSYSTQLTVFDANRVGTLVFYIRRYV